MKKTKRTLKLLISFIAISLILIFNKSFASSVNLSAGRTSMKVGETTTVTGSVTSGDWNLTLSGNGQSRHLVSNNGTKAGNASDSASITFSPSAPGSCTFTLTGDETDYYTEQTVDVSKSVTIYVSAADPAPTPTPTPTPSAPKKNDVTHEGTNNNNTQSTTDNKQKSNNTHLKSLTVSAGSLNTAFNRDNQNYSLVFSNQDELKNLTQITINAEAEDGNAKVTGTGTFAVKNGEQSFSIRVTAENGINYRTYVISLNKPADTTENADNLKIETLEINAVDEDGNQTKVDLDKDFNPDELEYSINVDENIKSLSINAKVGDDTIVTIDGADNLLPGENIVTVTLTSKNDETIKKVYTIKVNKAGNTDDDMENLIMDNEILGENSKRPLTKSLIVGLIILIAILVVVLITLLVVNKKKKKNKALKDEDIDDEIPDEEFDNSDSDDKKEEKEDLTSEEPKEEKENGNNDEIENDEAENADSSKYEDDSKDKNFEENDEEDNNKKFDDEEDFEEDSSDDWNNGDNTDWKKGKRHKGKHF